MNSSLPAAPTVSSKTPAQSAALSSVAGPVDSAALLQGRKMVEIAHNGVIYRLQVTQQGKLILTK